MRAKVKAVCLGIEKDDFTKKDTGEVITYRRAKFSVRGTTEVKRLPGTRNRSSMDAPTARETSTASLSEGLYFPASKRLIVSLRTRTRIANSSCVRPAIWRYLLRLQVNSPMGSCPTTPRRCGMLWHRRTTTPSNQMRPQARRLRRLQGSSRPRSPSGAPRTPPRETPQPKPIASSPSTARRIFVVDPAQNEEGKEGEEREIEQVARIPRCKIAQADETPKLSNAFLMRMAAPFRLSDTRNM